MSYTAKDGARTRSCHLHTLAEENVCTSDKPCRHVLDRTRVLDCSNRGSVDDDSVVKEKQEVVPAHAITTTRFVTSTLFPIPALPSFTTTQTLFWSCSPRTFRISRQVSCPSFLCSSSLALKPRHGPGTPVVGGRFYSSTATASSPESPRWQTPSPYQAACMRPRATWT